MGNEDRQMEYAKAVTEYFKHLATLAVGSIVVIATFLEKVFPNPCWKGAVTVSLIGFLVSVVANAIVYTLHLLWSFPAERNGDGIVSNNQMVALAITYLLTIFGFLVGIVALGVFAIVNLSA
jgi:hypothetical protein